MKSKIKNISACEKRLTIEVSQEEVAAGYEEVYREFQKVAEAPGFRKGKVPREVVVKHHGERARREVIERLVSSTLKSAIAEAGMKPVGRLEVVDVKLDDQRGLSFSAKVEVEPQLTLGTYKGLKLKRPRAAVTDDELMEALRQLQTAHAQSVPVEGSTEKQTQLPALDDEFAKDLGCATLEELQGRIRRELDARQATRAQAEVENQLYDALLKTTPFEVPPSLVTAQAERLRRDLSMRLMLRGVKEADLETELKQWEQRLKTDAVRQVKILFVLERIADAEKITVSQEELLQRLAVLAQQYQRSVEVLVKDLSKQRAWSDVLAQLRQDKTAAWLLQQAAIEEAA
ncbi:MAG: trigger factor [Candidatus Omnitrophica bacterium]|nr:trigger factor [Candidatus Omnitrophota bacterium]